jgi:NAD(P)-dependent dehydrogenase (short-subunit alcohol dehydrogenase family)
MSPTSSNSLVRYVIRPQEEQLKLPSHRRGVRGLFLIAEDGLGVAKELAERIIADDGFAYIIASEKCLEESQIQAECTVAQNLFGKIGGIIHLAGLNAMPMPQDMTSWRTETQLQCKSFFQLLKFAREDLNKSEGTVFNKLISCSLHGGHYGRDLVQQPGLPIAGGGQGLLRSLEYEWNNILAKTIDFDLALSAKAMAEIIMEELVVDGGQLEIGYPEGKRIVFHSHRAPLQPVPKPKGLIPQKKWVILATGGGRGITSQTIQMLSNEDNHFVLIGKSELLDRSDYQKYAMMDKAQLRSLFIQEAVASKGAITPKDIESKISKILNDREIRENIARLRKIGSRVTYFPCNVSDAGAFGGLIDQIYDEIGNIDIVIHGAGIIEDSLVDDKTSASFDRVFDTKVDSAYILYRKLKWESLKGFIVFSSTAGRYGNRGQADYAAANELLTRFAWRIRAEWPHVLVKSLNWGPWTGVGMASGVVNKQFIDRGIIPIDVSNGVRYFIGELLHGKPEEVEVILGEGTWNPARENLLRDIFNTDFFLNSPFN